MFRFLVAGDAVWASRRSLTVRAVSAVLALLLGLSASAPVYADVQSTHSWIVRSEIQSNHSMLVPGPGASIHAADSYRFESWPFRGGFDWSVHLDPGTLTGNVEGALTATYQNTLAQPGHTTVQLTYGGIADESRVTGNLKANISITPTVGVNVLGVWGDVGLPITAVNSNLTTNADFTTGIGTVTATDSARQTMVEVGGDLLILHYGVSVLANCSISFTPRLLNGVLIAEHVDTGLRRTSVVDFWADGTLGFDLNLDQPGDWKITLEDFYLEQGDFRTQFGFGVLFSMGIPLTGTSAGFGGDIVVHDSGYFRPRFEKHWLYDQTVGEFRIHVVPEPSALLLLGAGALALKRRRRC
ncbi:MAG: PEP-CTERM sorting domain-containing protein [Planctomycetes bacterium]|nr:PEP-CTERM sorting domain-containing protein [Planctomycetota bacterium]